MLKIPFKYLILCLNFFICSIALGNNNPTAIIISSYNSQQYDHQINRIYQTLLKNPNENIDTRFEQVSKYFINQPYFLGALGEGPEGQFDQNPLYRTDKFDCETFVDTVLALANAKSLPQFKDKINEIRYENGEVAYVNRNHFTSIDWNLNNEKAGYIKDVTADLSIPFKRVNALINKPSWFRAKQVDSLKLLQPISSQQQTELLQQLRDQSKEVHAAFSPIPYIPFAVLYTPKGNQLIPNAKVFAAIPSPAIIEIVCANCYHPDLGTLVDVKHMGLVIRTKQGLIFREASEVNGKVIDVSLIDYLKWDYQRFDPDQAGINIHIIAL